MAEEGSVITQEMRDRVGVESAPTRNEVDKTGIRMFARSVGHTDPVFYDEDEAKRRGFRSLLAPPGYLGTPAFSPRSAGEAYGGPRMGPYKRILNGGTEIEQFGEVCAGDVLMSRTKVASLTESKGSMGPMLITVSETSYTNQDGAVVAVSRGTLISY